MDIGRLILTTCARILSFMCVCGIYVSGIFFLSPPSAFSQSGNTDGEWASYAADAGSTKYTSLDQIDADNFDELEIVWRWASIDGDLDFEAMLGP